MAEYKVPGVFVEELYGLSLSIQAGATAIPVFAYDTSVLGDLLAKNNVVGLDSWLDVTTKYGKARDEKRGTPKASETEEEKKTREATLREFDYSYNKDSLYQSLKLYFLNGGGRAYVAPVDKLAEMVPGLDDVTLLVQAGSGHAKFASAVGQLCKKGNTYFAVYDGPTSVLTTESVVTAADTYNTNEYAAVYYPWLQVKIPTKTLDPEHPDKTEPVDVPPSGPVAGAYAKVDRERGVWKAPANVEIVGAEPKCKVSEAVDEKCNAPVGPKAINVIRAFRGTGPLIWGARTLDVSQSTWKYVPVRRFFNAVEKDIRMAMSTALFEPNSAPTWERVRGAVESYVHSLWLQGALQGDTPEHAYFVHIGLGITMTEEDIKNGKMVITVGLSAVRPAEFIVLQLTQDVVPA